MFLAWGWTPNVSGPADRVWPEAAAVQPILSQLRQGGWPWQSACHSVAMTTRLPGRGSSGTLGDRTKQDFQTRDWERLQGVGLSTDGVLTCSVCTVDPFMSFSQENLKIGLWGRRDGSTVTSTACSCKGSRFDSQHPCRAHRSRRSDTLSGLPGYKACM